MSTRHEARAEEGAPGGWELERRGELATSQRTVTWHGPASGQLLIRRSFLPVEYHEGVLEALLTRYGLKNMKVRGQRLSPLDGTYDFSWE